MWSATGRELFYRSPAKAGVDFTAASLQLGPAPAATDRRRLFDISDIISTSPHANYDVSPDGRTFVMVRQNPVTRIMVLQNMPALFRQLERREKR